MFVFERIGSCLEIIVVYLCIKCLEANDISSLRALKQLNILPLTQVGSIFKVGSNISKKSRSSNLLFG